ncbi:MAG: hypothetical protein AB7U73_21020 [Pirellulales bacterium]
MLLTDLGPGVNPQAINNAGQVTGQAAGQAFLWSAGVLTPLGTLGGAESFGNDLNDSGVVVGWSYDADGVQKGFKWQAGVMTNLDSVTALGSSAEAINVYDEIVGWKTNSSVYRSAWWLNANIAVGGQLMFGLGNHKALGINDQGKIVGVALDASNDLDEGFYWNGADPITGPSGGLGLDYFPLAGVNNQDLTTGMFGDLAASMAIGDSSPTSAGTVASNDLFSIALGLNDAGLIVGESDGKGFLFDRPTGTMHDLNQFARGGFAVDTIVRLTDINNQAAFVGVATVGGVEHAIYGQFVPVPEPATCLLALGGLAVLLAAHAGGILRRGLS